MKVNMTLEWEDRDEAWVLRIKPNQIRFKANGELFRGYDRAQWTRWAVYFKWLIED